MLVLYIIWSLSYFSSRLTLSCPLMFSSCIISPVNVFQFYPLSPLYFYNPLKVKVKSLSPVRLFDPMDCSPPGSSVHGILQARMLEWVAISFSRGSSQSRDQTQVSCIAGRHFTLWTTFSTYLIWSTLYFKADNFYGLTYYFLNCKWWKLQVVETGSICTLNIWLLFILLTGPRFCSVSAWRMWTHLLPSSFPAASCLKYDPGTYERGKWVWAGATLWTRGWEIHAKSDASEQRRVQHWSQ